jgi:dolichyl-phosphate beta-glucosyltransferase
LNLAFSNNIKLTIVVPCYNEQERINDLELEILNFLKIWGNNIELIIVNDGSKDSTASIIENSNFFSDLKTKNNFIFISLSKNLGKGGAIQQGVLKASGDFILTMDADIATHPNELFNWLNILGEPFKNDEILIGSRTHKQSKLVEKPYRKLTGYIFNFFVRTLTGIKFTDSQCGFKLYPAQIAKKLFINLFEKGWAHDVEILYKAQLKKIKIIDMPVNWTVKDNSKINVLSDSFKMFFQLIKISIRTKKAIKNEA